MTGKLKHITQLRKGKAMDALKCENFLLHFLGPEWPLPDAPKNLNFEVDAGFYEQPVKLMKNRGNVFY